MSLDVKIILNVFYPPTEELKGKIECNRNLYIAMNGGASLKGDEWANTYLQSDDVGDNISSQNKLINEMTSIYWVWKHYAEIGNPKYIGFNHYRRFFKTSDFEDIDSYDIVVANSIKCPYTLAWQYNYYHKISDIQHAANVLRGINKTFGDGFVSYLNEKTDNFAPCNMFIMKRELFFEWCELIFKVLDVLKDTIDLNDGRDNYQKRALCFITERIFGYWCYVKSQSIKLKTIDIEEHLSYKDNHLNERGDFS